MIDLNLSQQLLVRRSTVPDYNEAQQCLPGGNSRGESLFAQALPERSELVRQGKSWAAAIPTGSAFTYVAGWPTTRAELVLYNGEAANGLTYVLDRVWMANITSMAAAQFASILYQCSPVNHGIAAATDNTAILKWSLSGKQNVYNGNAKLAVANTAFALTNLWTTIGAPINAAMTTNLGATCEANVFGRFLIPPGACGCFAGLAGTAVGTAIIGVEWHEVQMPVI